MGHKGTFLWWHWVILRDELIDVRGGVVGVCVCILRFEITPPHLYYWFHFGGTPFQFVHSVWNKFWYLSRLDKFEISFDICPVLSQTRGKTTLFPDLSRSLDRTPITIWYDRLTEMSFLFHLKEDRSIVFHQNVEPRSTDEFNPRLKWGRGVFLLCISVVEGKNVKYPYRESRNSFRNKRTRVSIHP